MKYASKVIEEIMEAIKPLSQEGRLKIIDRARKIVQIEGFISDRDEERVNHCKHLNEQNAKSRETISKLKERILYND